MPKKKSSVFLLTASFLETVTT